MWGLLMAVVSSVIMSHAMAGAQFTGVAEERLADITLPFEVVLEEAQQGLTLGVSLTIGFPDGHDFLTGEIVDVHWIDPNTFDVHEARRGLEVNNVLPTFIDFVGGVGEGDSIPTFAGADVFVSRPTVLGPINIDPTDLVMIGAGTNRVGIVDFRDSTSSLHFQKLARFGSWFWISDFQWENILLGGGNISEVRMSTMDTRGARFYVFINYDL